MVAASSSSTVPAAFVLSQAEKDTYAQLAASLVADAVREYEAFCAPPTRRHVNPLEWKLIKSDDDISVHKGRRRSTSRHSRSVPSPPPPMLRTVGGASESVQSKVAIPWMLVTGTTPGTVDDLIYGAFVDSNLAQSMRAHYINDHAKNYQFLTQTTTPSEQAPHQFGCISWAEIRDSGIPFVKRRDLLTMSASGTTTLSENGERVGYYLVHSVAAPRQLQQQRLDHRLIRAQCSFCYVFRQCDFGKVEVYQRGFFAAMGDLPERSVLAAVTKNLLTPMKLIKAAYGKKLLYMMLHAPRKPTSSVTSSSSASGSSRSPPLGGCAAGCRSKFGRALRTQGACVVCDAQVCSSCKVVKKIAFAAAASTATGARAVVKALDFCVVCVAQAKTMDALIFARQELLAKQSQTTHQSARHEKDFSKSQGPRRSRRETTTTTSEQQHIVDWPRHEIKVDQHQYQHHEQPVPGGDIVFLTGEWPPQHELAPQHPQHQQQQLRATQTNARRASSNPAIDGIVQRGILL